MDGIAVRNTNFHVHGGCEWLLLAKMAIDIYVEDGALGQCYQR